ncbi:MAG TPA: L-histidine N(alpha)-methyltransferase [Acidimicrobiales bacterium]|nr:L-histidine N(alpha)-methyltransferase [Acidimicrobiales bacterium]
MSIPAAAPAIDVHLDRHDWRRALLDEARRSLTATPRELSPTWFYDERGCELFEAITQLPEYYPTRTERSILVDHAADVAATGADTLVELGAGSATKTRILLDAMQDAGRLARYVPFDVAESAVRSTAGAVAGEYPDIGVHGVVGDFRRHLGRIPGGGRRVVAFLGGTIGNLRPEERRTMLADLAGTMAPGDALLLGTDLVKDRDRLVAAYDDGAGVTAAFNRNVLNVLNQETGAEFEPERFEHVARFDDDNEWIEMHLRSVGQQQVPVPGLGIDLDLSDGESIRTEISAKFRPERVDDELAGAGLRLHEWWTDPNADFALSLAVR